MIYAITKAIFGDGSISMDATIRNMVRASGSKIKNNMNLGDDYEEDNFDIEEQEITTFEK